MRFILLFVPTFFLVYLLFAQENDPYRLSPDVTPTFQFIHLNLDPDKDDYDGYTVIDLKIIQPMSSFRLHGKDFEITHIKLEHDNTEIPMIYEFKEFGFLNIKPERQMENGVYKLSISFKGSISKKGEGISWYTKDSLNYIYTQMQEIYARQFFPCFDEPGFKFPYQIEITAPKEYLVVSNTVEKNIIKTTEDKTVLFNTTKPIPSYLLAFAVGPYETVDIPGLKKILGRIILPKGYSDKSLYARSITAKILNSLEDYFGSPYPYDKLDFLSASNYNFGAMENPGLVVYLDQFLIDSDELSLSSKYEIANVVTHELAHMWFGDLVTLKWWNDTWLNEGFASWLADEIILSEFPELNSVDAMYRNFAWSVRNDANESTTPIIRKIAGNEKPIEAFDALSYSKSQVVLRMLENWMGRETFRQGLQLYFQKFKWGNTESVDLYKCLANETDKPVLEMLENFTQQPGVPIVRCKVQDNKLILTQKRLKTVEVEQIYDQKWLIPLNIKIFDGDKIHHKQIVLDKLQKEFEFPDIKKIEWLHLKNNVTGYYLMLLPADIAKKAIISNKLTTTEIQDIFQGLQYGWKAGKVNPVEILELAFGFRDSGNKDIINGLAGRISDIKDIFSNKATASLFKEYMETTVTPMLETIGKEISDSLTSVEIQSQGFLMDALDPDSLMIAEISRLARVYLASKTLSYDYYDHLKILIYNYGNDSLYNYVKEKLIATRDPGERAVLIETIGYFKDDFIFKNLDFVLNGDLEPNERMVIPVYINLMRDYEKKYLGKTADINIIDWINKNDDFFKTSVADIMYNFFLPFLVNNRKDLNEFETLFPKETRPKTMQIQLNKRISEIKRHEKLVSLFGEDVKQYLLNFKNNNILKSN